MRCECLQDDEGKVIGTCGAHTNYVMTQRASLAQELKRFKSGVSDLRDFIKEEQCTSGFLGEKAKLQRVLDKINQTSGWSDPTLNEGHWCDSASGRGYRWRHEPKDSCPVCIP